MEKDISKKTVISHSKKETQKMAAELLGRLDGTNTILLEGQLGAGKTTFAQGLLAAAGAEGPFTSPTFVVMKRYELKGRKKTAERFRSIYHFDCYRVEERDILEMGWQEIIADEKNLVLVEWPERINNLWPKGCRRLIFSVTGEDERCIEMEKSDEDEK